MTYITYHIWMNNLHDNVKGRGSYIVLFIDDIFYDIKSINPQQTLYSVWRFDKIVSEF